MDELHSQLQAVQDRVRSLRQDRARLRKILDSAKAAAAESESDAAFAAFEQAKQSLADVDQLLEQAGDEQVQTLSRLADRESGIAGFSLQRGVGSGWDRAATQLSLVDGRLRVDVQAASLLAGPVLPPSSSSTTSPLATAATPTAVASGALPSNRWLYPVFSAAPFGGSAADVTTTDYVVDIPFLGDAASGLTGVERDVDQTDNKAILTPTIDLATPVAKQQAVVLDAIPAKLFDSQQSLRALLSTEMSRRLSEAFDAHVVGKIESASPPTGSTGGDLVAKIRNAISDMRDLGGEPSVLALSPSDAAGLDLLEQPTVGGYIFSTRISGSGSPVWNLVVRESPTISNPTLISPAQLGLVYLGTASILVDPYGPNLKQNLVSVRCEAEGTFHVRNVKQGAYVIGS